MNELKCGVLNCISNCGDKCCRVGIHVSGRGAKTKSDTCCESFSESRGGFQNSLYGTADLAKSDWPEGGNPFRKPHFLLINLALGGWKNEVRNEPVTDAKTGKVLPATRFPMVMKVDYVRHYERIGNICEKNNGGK